MDRAPMSSGARRHWLSRRLSRHRTTTLAIVVAATLSFASCDESPTSLDPRIAPTTGPPSRLLVIDWRFGDPVTTARLEAIWGDSYVSSRDVTSESQWASTAPGVVGVAGPGRFVSASPGDAEIQVTFRGVTASRHLRVYPGEAPLLVLEPGDTTEVGAFIRDASGVGVEGVMLEIVGGYNTGRTAVTGPGGQYRFFPPFVCGPVTLRATKPGYREAEGSSVMCMTGMPPIVMLAGPFLRTAFLLAGPNRIVSGAAGECGSVDQTHVGARVAPGIHARPRVSER
jgi:hypothetical protein